MSASNRAAKLQKFHKALKKGFTAIKPPTDRTILEHLIYACCLENATYLAADEAFARLQETYLDWNEVRVTTVTELAECVSCLKDPEEAARRVKNTLHSVFETYYSWDLEFLKKENLGQAIKKLQSYKAISPFVVAYVVQNGLGGHSIPIDDAALVILYACEVIDENELRKKEVPGLERAIPKNKGVEFGSLLHQISADLHSSPYSPEKRNKVIAIEPSAKDRLPKRPSRKKAGPKKVAPKKKDAKKAAKAETKKKSKAVAKKTPAVRKPTAKKPGAKKPTPKKATSKKVTVKKKTAKKSSTKKPPKKKSGSLSRKKPR